jgi:hypothetical protein
MTIPGSRTGITVKVPKMTIPGSRTGITVKVPKMTIPGSRTGITVKVPKMTTPGSRTGITVKMRVLPKTTEVMIQMISLILLFDPMLNYICKGKHTGFGECN